ncbi:MAG: hypothetical protein J6I40_00480 [Mailhella sp.]|nr:hypothetical protein [Mailhella sp.]
MGYYATIGLVLSKEGDRQLKAGIALLTKEQAAVAQNYLRYPDLKKTHRKTGARLFIWNSVKEGPDFVMFFDKLLRSLPFESYKLIRIGDALDDSMEDGGFYDDPFSLRVERTLLFD